MDRYSLKAEESVFLDDTLANVEAGEKLGITGIHFKSQEQAIRELSALGVHS